LFHVVKIVKQNVERVEAICLFLSLISTDMKKRFTIISLALLPLLISQCATKKAASDDGVAAGVESAKVAEIKKQYSEAQIQEGMTIWQNSCVKCHKLFEPESRTIAKWETILPNMSMRAKLNQDQSAKFRAYILTHAKLG